MMKMVNKNTQSLSSSFKNAWQGILHAIVNERNFKIHLAFASLAIILCVILPIDRLHIFMVTYSIFLVLCTELINTAVEAAVDLCCGNKIHPLAKIAKDCCAGAVLLASVQAVIVAVFVAQHIISRL